MTEIIKIREEGYKTVEISDLTGIPRGTIAARLSRMNTIANSHEVEAKEIKPVA